MDDGPLVGVASPEVPSPRASHGEAHEGDAGLVDSVLVADGLDGFHDVGFPGGLVPDALAAEGVKDDAVLDGKVSGPAHSAVNEVEVGRLVAPAVQPDVEGDGTIEAKLGRNLQAVGLEGVGDLGAKAAHDEAL